MKKVLEACIDQILQFDSEKEFEVFVEGLERKPQQFKVVNHYGLADGRHIARVRLFLPVAIFEAMFEVMLPKFFDFNVSLDDTRKEGGQDGET